MIFFIIIFLGAPCVCCVSQLKAKMSLGGASSEAEATATSTTALGHVLQQQQEPELELEPKPEQERLQDASLNDCFQLQQNLTEARYHRIDLLHYRKAMLKRLCFREEQNTKTEIENLRTSEKLKLLELDFVCNRIQKLELKLEMKRVRNRYHLRKCRRLLLKFKNINRGSSLKRFSQKRRLLGELKLEESRIRLAYQDLRRFAHSQDERGLERILKVLRNNKNVYGWLHNKLTITVRKDPESAE